MFLGFEGKRILIGVTGSIAAFKAASLVSRLVQLGAEVHVMMTEAAAVLVGPATFRALTKGRVYLDSWEGTGLEHIHLTQDLDLFLLAPATANTIAKLAAGVADNLLTSAALAVEGPSLIAPAMNSRMYKNAITQKNIQSLQKRGFSILSPGEGHLACGEQGTGRLAELEHILIEGEYLITEKDLQGLSFLITAGPTREAVDDVRFLSNYSTGRMGYALAHRAVQRGGEVLLISGPTHLKPPPRATFKAVEGAQDMYREVFNGYSRAQVVIKAAAVSDYRPAHYWKGKQKKDSLSWNLELTPNPDILLALGKNKRAGSILVGFAAEAEDLIRAARKKREKKNLDLIVANDISQDGAGFASSTNVVTLIGEDGEEQLPCLQKEMVAEIILDRVLQLRKDQGLS